MRYALLALPLGVGVATGVFRHSIGSGFLALYATLFAGALIWSLFRRRLDTVDVIDAMNGTEFEDYVADRLSRAGWLVRFTPQVGDYGVDLIAEKAGQSVAVQCKRYAKPVGVAAVQEVVSGARHYGCTRAIVVSNQEFTRAAQQLALSHGCQLIGRRTLHNWVPAPTQRTPARQPLETARSPSPRPR